MALAVTGVSIQLPSSRHRLSSPLASHLLCLGHLSPRRPRPLSISLPATATSAFSSASPAPPWTPRSSHNNQPLDELLETDGGDRDGGSPGGGAVGDHDGHSNMTAALMVPPREWDDWPPESPPADSDGSERFFELEKSPLLGWLLRFGGIKERLLAEDVFFKELEHVFADAAMIVVADFMLAHLLPAPTASLPPALLAKFFHGFPANAFQIALPGSSYSLAQRLGAIPLNGAKLFDVGAASSMVRTAVRNALIGARNFAGKSSGSEVENVPILSTSLAYGLYTAISDNLRSQVLDGIIEQRILEPLLHQHKFTLSAICFAVRTGNTFLGSRLWIDYARWVGIQN